MGPRYKFQDVTKEIKMSKVVSSFLKQNPLWARNLTLQED